MAFELTPAVAGQSLIIMAIIYGVTVIFSAYQLYLNWKQAKVKNTTEELVKLIKENNTIIMDIRNMLVIVNDQATETKDLLKEAVRR
jgi:hypothetical protein